MEFAQFQAYLDSKIAELKDDIKESIHERTQPIKEDIERLRENSKQHYQEVKTLRESFSDYKENQSIRIGKLEGRVDILEDDKEDTKIGTQLEQSKKTNKITIILFAISFPISIIVTYLLSRGG